MHGNSMNAMKKLLAGLDASTPRIVLDVGSRCYANDISYRDAMSSPQWKYFGLDMEPGHNVACVVEPCSGWPFKDGSFDVVISGQCIEHTENTHFLFSELGRVLKPGGFAFVIAPWSWGIHYCPRDYWRILPDGMEFLLGKCAGLEVLKTFTIDTTLDRAAARGGIAAADLLVRAPNEEGPGTPLRDYLLDGGVRLGGIVVEGDCVGVARKAGG